LRNKLIPNSVKYNSEGERSEYEKSAYEKSEAGSDDERDNQLKMLENASPSYTNKTSTTSALNRGGEEAKEPELKDLVCELPPINPSFFTAISRPGVL
jgi:hypothetical protein